MGRLYQLASGGATTRIGYDGLDRIAEYDGSNAVQRRYIHGPGIDEPVTWYEGSGTTTRRFLSSDERGSVISVTDGSGTMLSLNKYDEFGVPQTTNLGKFGYTGQAWLPEVGFWYYKARFYRPDIGRFMQTDPIGFGAGMNVYAYVRNDPVNWIDPLGLCGANEIMISVPAPGPAPGSGTEGDPIVATVWRYCFWLPHTEGPRFEIGDYRGFPGEIIGGVDRLIEEIAEKITDMLCITPTVGGGAGVDAYAGVGGSLSGGASFNPRNGQFSFGFDLGVGIGLGGGAKIAGGKGLGVGQGSSDELAVVTAGLNANATAAYGVGITGSYQMIGSNPGDWSVGYAGGPIATANANVSGHVQANLPSLYELDCN